LCEKISHNALLYLGDIISILNQEEKSRRQSVKHELSPHKYVPPQAAEWRQI